MGRKKAELGKMPTAAKEARCDVMTWPHDNA